MTPLHVLLVALGVVSAPPTSTGWLADQPTSSSSDEATFNVGKPMAGFEKFLLTDAAKKGAVCLDGSPGGGYIRKGDPKKWIIFHQGGGWCSSDAACAQRANCSNSPKGCIMGGTCCALGSSTVWGPTYTDSYESSQIFADPAFADYTAVYAMYCDGGSWTGNAAAPVKVGSATIHYRGRPLLDALIDYALAGGLSTATNLLFGGCSAGGLTSYLHADYVASRMPVGVKTVAIADAMFSAITNPNNTFPDSMKWGHSAWNSTGSANDACEASYGKTDAWKCFFGQNVAKFIKTSMFVLNSKYDSWQGPAIIGCSTPIKNCPAATQKLWVDYGKNMATAAMALPPQHGAFIANCRAHCQTGTAAAWTGTTVNGTAMGAAFVKWYQHAIGDGGSSTEEAAAATSLFRWVESEPVCDGNDGSCAAVGSKCLGH